VVLVGNWRAEEGHDSVAQHLVDGPLVAVHGVHQDAEHGVEEPARLLGVPIGEQLHRALQVGEEDRHLLASPSSAALDVRIFWARCLGV
jgi:hypothetical protein